MDYEELYSEYSEKEKELREQLNAQQKYFKRLIKEMENGDLKGATRDILALQESSKNLEQASSDALAIMQGFDMGEYISGGAFAEQLLLWCERLGIDAKGENNSYELFPYKLRLDGENAEVILDKKKTPYQRPQNLAKFIKAQRDRLMASLFNPSAFAEELAYAYDLALIVQAKEKKREIAHEGDVDLREVYKYLTPMKRFRKDYELQNFAFDIARLCSAELEGIEDGRKFQFGPSRNINKSIRILDKDSQERYFATIRFFRD